MRRIVVAAEYTVQDLGIEHWQLVPAVAAHRLVDPQSIERLRVEEIEQRPLSAPVE